MHCYKFKWPDNSAAGFLFLLSSEKQKYFSCHFALMGTKTSSSCLFVASEFNRQSLFWVLKFGYVKLICVCAQVRDDYWRVREKTFNVLCPKKTWIFLNVYVCEKRTTGDFSTVVTCGRHQIMVKIKNCRQHFQIVSSPPLLVKRHFTFLIPVFCLTTKDINPHTNIPCACRNMPMRVEKKTGLTRRKTAAKTLLEIIYFSLHCKAKS